ncbi:MAG: hypothetical protein Q7W13_13235 [Bacteroidia bacterium]|nr:hypothetical protein [Bacteroidia bacterium]
MKTIRIVQISKEQKKYVINLGNGTSNSFSSKREAESFLYNTNLFLTDKLHALHKLYCETWNAFQDNWFYLDNDRKTPKFAIKETERKCVQNLDAIKSLLSLSVDRCYFTNGNYFVFVHFNKIADYLEETIRLLAQVYGKHSNTNAICKMDISIRHILFARNELSNYGKYSTTRIFKIPTHISENKSYVPDYNLAIVA